MKILVIGGTGFLGRVLVRYLVENGNEVTVSSSGKRSTSILGVKECLIFDRFNPQSLVNSVSRLGHFDIVYDQLAFRIKDVKDLVKLLEGKTESYVFASSAAVYEGKSGILSEEDFDPYTYEYDERESEKTYAEGKRNVEAYVYQNAEFPVSSARFPSIFGNCDSTLRFQDHLKRIEEGKPFWAPGNSGRRNYAWVDDAGLFLAWLGTKKKLGPFNGASEEYFDIRSFLELIGHSMGKDVSFQSKSKLDKSRYYKEEDFILSTYKANKEGFRFAGTEEWLKMEVANYRLNPCPERSSQDYADSLFP